MEIIFANSPNRSIELLWSFDLVHFVTELVQLSVFI